MTVAAQCAYAQKSVPIEGTLLLWGDVACLHAKRRPARVGGEHEADCIAEMLVGQGVALHQLVMNVRLPCFSTNLSRTL